MKIENGLISVIMSNYNTPEKYLREAIESVLNQSYVNFEFIIVDDCSTDQSLSVVESYDDKRIVVLKNEVNMGITKSLNKALKLAKGEFVARMDADDICFSNRFVKQVNFLRENPNVIVCGTWAEFIGDWEKEHSKNESCRIIPDQETYRIHLLFGNYPNIIHPSAMFRHEMLLKNNIQYNEHYRFAQDYRMWVSCSNYGECANVTEILLKYRIHGKAVSSDKKVLQHECTLGIIQEQLNKLDIKLVEKNENIHVNLLFERQRYDLKYKKWIKYIIKQNKKYHVYNEKKLKNILWKKWAEITYFGIRETDNYFLRIKILLKMPLIYMGKLFEIRTERIKSSG